MSEQPAGSPPLESLRQEIRTIHPGIAAELQGAINTLRKLQQIAGAPLEMGSERPTGRAGDASLIGAVPAELGATFVSPSTSDTAATYIQPPADAMDRAAPILAVRENFGRYQIVRLLGRGAMGAVYLAYDSQLHRHVALKTPTLGNRPEVLERFYREARTAAQLRSPYLCPIFDVGQVGDVHYLSMAYIEGQPLSRLIAERRLRGEREIVSLVQKVARGLQKAHEQEIVHRDLKPDNIMIDGDGEPIVMDFGLARSTGDDVRLTSAGQLLGTPAYMSPEQVEGDQSRIGPASDIYSLGVVLYELLTGQIPFQGSVISVLRCITQQPPPRPSAVAPHLSAGGPLERVCLKMMEKSPTDRFSSMAGAAEALASCIAIEAPIAQPAGERTTFWNRLATGIGRLGARARYR